MSFARLIICVIGIYASFLSWALIQERLSTTPYHNQGTPNDGKPKYFTSVIFLNTIQSGFSATAALIYLIFKKKSNQTILESLGLTNPSSNFQGKKSSSNKVDKNSDRQNKKKLFAKCFQCAILNSIGSPFGYASLKHIDYPTMILGKSCKLVPVMIMNILLYRRKFPFHKYLVVMLVTLGISLFMLFSDQSSKSNKGSKQSSWFGLSLLLINLMIDGATNSTQDEIFSRFTINGSQLMFIMNSLATLLTLVAIQLPVPHLISSLLNSSNSNPSSNNEFTIAIEFIKSHPKVLQDILLFSSAGAIGQLFIFETLSHFGSLTLVTITVTRKLFTMLLSVFFFNHQLKFGQWIGIAIVFLAIGIEAWVKMKSSSKKVQRVIEEEEKFKIKEI